MTWAEAQLSTQVMAEERIGAQMRRHAREMRDAEDAAADALRGGA